MSYKLTYFNLRGRAEPIRFLLAHGGESFEDYRIERGKWLDMKPSMPFGKVPLFEINGKTVNQSVAIERFLAKKYKLMGNDDFENLQIDAFVDTMVDLANDVVQFYHTEDKEIRETRKQTLLKDIFPLYFSKFDETVKRNGGYFVGNKMTWADIHFAAVVESFESMVDNSILEGYPNLILLKQNILKLPAIKAWVDKRPQTEF